MLTYHVVDYTPYDPDTWAQQGLQAPTGRDVLRWHIEPPATNAPVVVVDTRQLSTQAQAQGAAPTIPPRALCNVTPYRPPKCIRAAGGYVLPAHPTGSVPVVCTIYRRGVWDLPKGKQDAGETITACAQREVREEIGIEDITLHAPLGITSHGYATAHQYVVKTTHWFAMRTTTCAFVPQAQEGIRRVRWARWPVLQAHIGYESLRHHMHTVAPWIAHLYTT
ncbi:MAG: NUDIX domain-containing protein [Longimonas sp.]|uniref:NUDIX hydrolase n=1 Tax=Longimonas sp. TaxID=2039626 RepID=UPI003976E4B0